MQLQYTHHVFLVALTRQNVNLTAQAVYVTYVRVPGMKDNIEWIHGRGHLLALCSTFNDNDTAQI